MVNVSDIYENIIKEEQETQQITERGLLPSLALAASLALSNTGLAKTTPVSSVKKPTTVQAKAAPVVTAAKIGLTRGMRNNNPGNIIFNNNIKWNGAVGTDGRFVKFNTMESGVRALARILLVYQKKYGINTIEGIINKWAPPVENQTDKYIDFVCKNSGIDRHAKIDLKDTSQIYRIVDSIIKFENGKSIDDGTIARGIKAARM
jgi:hypothetical protein